MDLFLWIENMRKKPPAERRQFAFFVSVSTVAVIGVIWFIGFLIHISTLFSGDTSPQAPAPALPIKGEESPILPPYRN